MTISGALVQSSMKDFRSRWAAASLQRNASYMMATQVVNTGLGGVYWLLAARLFAPNQIGLATALVAAMTLSALIANLGAGTTLIELLPRARGQREWSRILLSALTISAASAAVLAGALVVVLPSLSSSFAPITDHLWVGAIFIAAVVFWTLSLVLDFAFVAERAAQYSLARNAAFSLLKLPLVATPLLFVSARGEILFATWAAATVASFLFGSLVLLPRMGRTLRYSDEGLWRQVRAMLRSLAGHHVVNLAAAGTIYALPLLVTIRLSTTATAYFYVTWMVAGLFLVVSPSVASALFAEGSHTPSDLQSQLKTAFLVILALVVPLGVILAAFGRSVLGIFGHSYATHGYILLLIVIAGSLPDAATTLVVAVLRVHRRLREAAALNVGIALLTLGLAWILLPPYGVSGAGIAWLAGQTLGVLVVLVMILFNRREGSPR